MLRERLLAPEEALARHADAYAAVAILLRERNGPEVLVMERAKRESDPWSGHWSFPGGRRHPGEDLLKAVSRETSEEVGLSPQGSQLIGCLPARPPANRLDWTVLPFVFAWDREDEPRPGPEVASVAWVSLRDLPHSRSTMTIRIRGQDREMPAFVGKPWAIWGFTYRLLEDLLALAS